MDSAQYIELKIRTLTNQHADLEVKIQQTMNQPGWNEHVVEDLKKQKLKIKDELARLHKARYEMLNEIDWD
jgi:hypothetical protein